MNDIEHSHDLAETIILSQEQTLHKLEEVQLSAEQRKAELNNLMDELIRTDVEPKRFTAIGRGENRILIHNFPHIYPDSTQKNTTIVQYFVITQHGYFGINYHTGSVSEDTKVGLQNPFTPSPQFEYSAPDYKYLHYVLHGTKARLWQSYLGISFKRDHEGVFQLHLKAKMAPILRLANKMKRIDSPLESALHWPRIQKLNPEQVEAVTNSLEETYVGYLEKAKKANEQLTGGVIFQRRKPKNE